MFLLFLVLLLLVAVVEVVGIVNTDEWVGVSNEFVLVGDELRTWGDDTWPSIPAIDAIS